MTESATEWFNRFPDLGKTPVFCQRIKLGSCSNPTRIIIRAYEGPVGPQGHTTTLFCELDIRRPDAKWQRLFAREGFWCGVNRFTSIDSDDAKELSISLFATLDQDNDAFESYTTEQQDFVQRFGEELRMVASDRYGER